MKENRVLTRIIEKTRKDEVNGIQFGRITRIDWENNLIFVVLKNEQNREISTRLANPYIDMNDLNWSLSRSGLVEVDFNTASGQPVIRDIHFSITQDKKAVENGERKKVLHIAADRIVIEGRIEVIIKSGNAKTVYQSKDGRLKEEADKIHSSATETNKILGSSVTIN